MCISEHAFAHKLGPGAAFVVRSLTMTNHTTPFLESSTANFDDRLRPLATVGAVDNNIIGSCQALFVRGWLHTILKQKSNRLLLELLLLSYSLRYSSTLAAAVWLLILLTDQLHTLYSNWWHVCRVCSASDQQVNTLPSDIVFVIIYNRNIWIILSL